MPLQRLSAAFTAPVTETRQLILTKQSDGPRTAQVRHLGKDGQTNPLTVKWQDSYNGSDWTDISGTAEVIDAGTPQAWVLTSNKPYVALAVYGDVDYVVEVGRSDPDVSPLTVAM